MGARKNHPFNISAATNATAYEVKHSGNSGSTPRQYARPGSVFLLPLFLKLLQLQNEACTVIQSRWRPVFQILRQKSAGALSGLEARRNSFYRWLLTAAFQDFQVVRLLSLLLYVLWIINYKI